MLMPNMIGLVMGKTWDQTLICLKNGGTPEVCSQRTGLSLELTQFWAQTDPRGFDGGQIKVKVIDTDATQSAFLAEFQSLGAIFGTDPLAGIDLTPGRTVFLRMAAEGRPRRGDTPPWGASHKRATRALRCSCYSKVSQSMATRLRPMALGTTRLTNNSALSLKACPILRSAS